MKLHSTTSDADNALLIATSFEADDGAHDLHLESCSELEWIVVRTRNSTYDLIVVSGDTGAVMVRGGQLFKEFVAATVVGSIFAGSAVQLRTIRVGCHLELCHDGKTFVTSRVEQVSRHVTQVSSGPA